GPSPNIDIPELVQAIGATSTTDTLTEVRPSLGSLTLASGEKREFDALVVATGARPEEAIPGAITFGAQRGTGRFRAMLEQAEEGGVARLVFAVPAEAGWPLALYELSLLTAARLRAAGASAELTLLTPERAPLAVFGGRASGAVLEELEDHGIHFVAGLTPEEIAWGELRARPGKVRIQADAVVTLPRLRGPSLPGLPHDERGFIPVDAHGLVRGTTNVYAAGDAVAFPVKHGGLAAQQAAAAAESIAARLGAPVAPAPFRPVLRGILLTGTQPRYLEGALEGSEGAASVRPLWWPPAKIAGHYLAPYLSGQVMSPPAAPRSVPIEVEIDPITATAQTVAVDR
ncbi:MAG TPA: FAD-dependent oxidoreductase, partial [Solirubrobacteraceae bacterium]|nr:FAD-dependent oxidoreductase [Solirubrobacteraceae bacterium]